MTRQRQPGDDDDDLPVPLSDLEMEEQGLELVPLGALLEGVGQGHALAAAEAAREVAKRARTPPAALDAERAVLGAMLGSVTAIDDVLPTGLRPTDFYRPAHALICGAIYDLVARNERADTITVVDELLRRGHLDGVGGAAAVSQLEAMLPTSAHAEAYARLVKDKATLRGLIETATRIVENAHRQSQRPLDIVRDAERAIFALGESSTSSVEVDRMETARRVLDAGIEGREPPGALTTGFPDLDAILRGGPRPGQQTIVAARPGMGKSALGYQLGMAAANAGEHVAFVSIEMTGDELIEREIAAEARRPYATWHQQHNHNASRATTAAGIVAERTRLHVYDRPGIDLAELCALARRARAQHGIRRLIVDHLGLIRPSGRYAGSRTQEVGEISRTMRALAGQLGIDVVLLCQLNRGPEQRTDKRPNMGDLRDSGEIEQDAQIILFIHRPEYYLRDQTPPDLERLAEIHVAKNRGGAIGTVNLIFDAPTTRFITPKQTEERAA